MKNPFTAIFLSLVAILATVVCATMLRNSEKGSDPSTIEKRKTDRSQPTTAAVQHSSAPLPVALRRIPEREGVLEVKQLNSRSFALSKVVQSEEISKDKIKVQMEKLRVRPGATDSAVRR